MRRKLTGLYAVMLIGIFSSAAAEEKILTIGISGTYSGGFASVGKSVSDGETDYLKWLGTDRGIEYKDPVSGKTEKAGINVIIEDNAYNPAKAASVYESFKMKRVNMIFGFGSTPGQVCAANASQDRIPYLSWYAYATPLGYKPKPQYYWTFLPTIAESATPMIKWFVKEKWQGPGTPKIGIMAADVPSWRVLGKPKMMDSYIRSLGGELSGIEFIPPVTPDLSMTVGKLVLEKGVNALILIGNSSQTVVLAKNLKQMGIDTAKITVLCNISAWDESLFKSIPHEVEGLYGEVHTVLPEENVPGMQKVREAAKKAGRGTEQIVVNYINGVIGAMVLEHAVRNALEKHGYEKVAQSGEFIRDELQNFKSFDPFGLTAPIAVLYQDQPYFYNHARIVRAENGRFKAESQWIQLDRIPGSLE
ncbi:MAG: hypothetical protein BWK80_10725 [Desulfobacteraceae bacterium IS3]|nr:MAG: hypothetical protein BWK80_10725 [Desulfobacteraceae bacterium IS3]